MHTDKQSNKHTLTQTHTHKHTDTLTHKTKKKPNEIFKKIYKHEKNISQFHHTTVLKRNYPSPSILYTKERTDKQASKQTNKQTSRILHQK